ncbi:MAG: type II secretion system protein [Bacilli bacterium]|nr:type II secretion system protein [Bacilli bacterium]
MKKGFTLIEMIGSVVILAMIAVVAFPAVLNLLNNSQGKIDDAMKNTAIGGAREYVTDHVNCYPRIGSLPAECSSVPNINNELLTVQVLLDKGYLTDSEINHHEEMKDDVIKITLSSEKNSRNQAMRYEYEYVEK